MDTPTRIARCTCGQVSFAAAGVPIVSSICYCRDCQAAGQRLQATDAAPICEADGGTHYLTYRQDRWTCLTGGALLVPQRLHPDAPTQRFVTRCCNCAMYLRYDPGFWISAYRRRFDGSVPPIEFRSQIRHRHADTDLPDDAPAFRGFPTRLFWKLAMARMAMALGQ
jgi:hypothetical protein